MLEQRAKAPASRITPPGGRGGQPEERQPPVRLDAPHEIEILEDRHVRDAARSPRAPAAGRRSPGRRTAVGRPRCAARPRARSSERKIPSPPGGRRRRRPHSAGSRAARSRASCQPAGRRVSACRNKIRSPFAFSLPRRSWAARPRSDSSTMAPASRARAGVASAAPPIDDDDLDPVPQEAPDQRADAFRLVERRDHDRDHHGARA